MRFSVTNKSPLPLQAPAASPGRLPGHRLRSGSHRRHEGVRTYYPQSDVIIELGGEDAKITYLTGGNEHRMNGNCAGGTGAFIDQMAMLLHTDASGLNALAEKSDTLYPIAARCGVFAKTDIQALLNEGASKENVAASVFQSIVFQTITGLACGRPIKGTVCFLGGPLTYLRSCAVSSPRPFI